ncbi:transmembrane protein 164 isoform X2 [Bacillus rossius redtenbacheri]|uniref:transmembrane protein 164 isoform X2 n=1 Tax=Bacillus rossius redtenbacheri TaxID=93214 RepID=UPI002FDE2C40
MFEWAYSGVDSSVPGNGGVECASFLSARRRIVETVVVVIFALVLISWGFKSLSIPKDDFYQPKRRGNLVLVLVCIIWGIEIGFKLASQTVIYLLNPCHVTTAVQIYLLAAAPSRAVTVLFRLHMNFLNGAVLACVFPVTESRLLPCETSIYWIQHGMMMVVPYYLIRLGGPYNVESILDMSWCSLAYGINLLYHFVILQAVAIPTEVNLNNMLCPATSDPFRGQSYRAVAVLHQALLCPVTYKLCCCAASLLAPRRDDDAATANGRLRGE